MRTYNQSIKNKSLQNNSQKLPFLPKKEQSRKAEHQRGLGGFHEQTRTQAKTNYQVQVSSCIQIKPEKLPLLPKKEQSRKAEQQRGLGGFHEQTRTQAHNNFLIRDPTFQRNDVRQSKTQKRIFKNK